MTKIVGITLAVTLGVILGTFGTEKIRAVHNVYKLQHKVETVLYNCAKGAASERIRDSFFDEKWCANVAKFYLTSNIDYVKAVMSPVHVIEDNISLYKTVANVWGLNL